MHLGEAANLCMPISSCASESKEAAYNPEEWTNKSIQRQNLGATNIYYVQGRGQTADRAPYLAAAAAAVAVAADVLLSHYAHTLQSRRSV